MPALPVAGVQREIERDALIREQGFDTRQKLVDALPGQRRNQHRPRLGRAPPRRVEQNQGALGIDGVDFVPDFENTPRFFKINSEFGEHLLDIGALRLAVIMRDIAHMQDDIRLQNFLKRRLESGDQHGRQIGYEAHCIGEDDLAAARQLDCPQRRIERCEQQILGEDAGLRQPVEQRRLAGIGVADERHDRIGHGAPALAVQAAGFLDLFEIALDPRDALLNQPAVGLDLRLARTAQKAETAALALKMGPGAHETRLLIVEMRKLDLQRAFPRQRPAAENFQNQTGAVDHLAVESLF